MVIILHLNVDRSNVICELNRNEYRNQECKSASYFLHSYHSVFMSQCSGQGDFGVE